MRRSYPVSRCDVAAVALPLAVHDLHVWVQEAVLFPVNAQRQVCRRTIVDDEFNSTFSLRTIIEGCSKRQLICAGFEVIDAEFHVEIAGGHQSSPVRTHRDPTRLLAIE